MLSGLVAFVVYTASLAHGVGVDDSGELMAAACEPGIVHPPGYPLLTMLGHGMAKLAIGDIGIRLNLLSAIFGAFAAWLVARAVAIATGSPAAVLVTAGLWIFAPIIWSWSTVLEVFAINNCFTALLINLNLMMQKSPSRHLLYAWFAVLGIALTNQLTILFWVPFGGLWLLWVDHKLFLKPRILGGILFSLGFGLLPYLYLPLAQTWRPQVAWGDFSSFTGMIRHIARVEFGPMSMANTTLSAGEAFVANFKFFLDAQVEHLLVVGIIPVVAALAWWRHPQARPVAVSASFIAAAWVFYALVFQYLANIDVKNAVYLRMLSRFWPQPFLYLAVLAGFGSAWLIYGIRYFHRSAAVPHAISAPKPGRNTKDQQQAGAFSRTNDRFHLPASKNHQMEAIVSSQAGEGHQSISSCESKSGGISLLGRISSAGGAREYLALGVAIILTCIQAWQGNQKRIIDASDLYTAIGSSALAAVESNALVITQGDFHYNILAYLKHCRRLRDDIAIIRQEILPAAWARRYLTDAPQPMLAHDASLSEGVTGNAITLGEVFRYNLPRRPVYMADDQLYLSDQSPYMYVPMPLLFRVRRSDDPNWLQDVQRGEEHFPSMITALQANANILYDPWPMLIEDTVWISRANFGQFLLEIARDPRRSPDERRLAMQQTGDALNQVAARWPRAAPGVWKNLGLYYYLNQSSNPTLVPETIRIWQRYLDQIPADAEDRAAITEILNNLRKR